MKRFRSTVQQFIGLLRRLTLGEIRFGSLKISHGIRDLLIALRHRLLSPYTSFVAVEEQVTRPAEERAHSEAVLNTRPRGQSLQGIAYPSTATTGPAKAWLCTVAIFLAIMLCVLRRPELDYAEVTALSEVGPGDWQADMTSEQAEQVVRQLDVESRYAGYIDRQQREIERHARQESLALPRDIDYASVSGSTLGRGDQFSVLVLSDDRGAVLREVASPVR